MIIGTDENFQSEVINSDKLTLVDFWADWCMPCKLIESSIEELAEEYKDTLKVVKFNVDENPNIPAQLGITGIPTVIFYKNGEMVERLVGAMTKPQYEEIIKQYS